MPDPAVAEVFGTQWPRLVATLRADFGDLDLAEDAAGHAFAVAAERWPHEGMPDAPGAWLVTVARRWAIDQARRDVRWRQRQSDVKAMIETPPRERGAVDDDLLAMIFGCCHRALDEPAQVALTLRYVVGLPTAAIARSFLLPEATMAKRLVRAKKKVAASGIPFRVPDRSDLGSPLSEVLRVVYVIYTQGHAAPSGELIRGDLCDEARWLAGSLCELLPDQSEVWGLAALLAFTDARRPARLDADGEVVVLQDQDRTLWNARAVADGRRLLDTALRMRRIGTYQLQAAIAAAHTTAPSFEATDWRTIRRLYAALAHIEPTPIVGLNEAVAVSMAEGPAAGLARLADLDAELGDYHYFHLARADMLAAAGEVDQARAAFARAEELCGNPAEVRAIRRVAVSRLDEATARLPGAS
ncbi:RNA polymerase sigma factor [Microbacterium koreense]|uniref:RNA polymerase sigma factor n=1 Tax=Microbacterium koreense TaxID=323761 RepID=A0ABW2ZQY2_9MICO